jgi:predicted nuclease with TOPRIM domain
MVKDTDEIIIPLLKSMRSDMDQIMHDIGDLKFRTAQIEETLTHHTGRFDRADDRLARIEKRLELTSA